MKVGWLRFFFVAMLICTGGNLVFVASNPSGPVVLGLIGSSLLSLGFGLDLMRRSRRAMNKRQPLN